MEFSIEDILSTLVAAIFVCISIMARMGKKKAHKAEEMHAPQTPWSTKSQKVNESMEEQMTHSDSSEVIFDEISHKPRPKRKKISKAQRTKANAQVPQNATNRTLQRKIETEAQAPIESKPSFKFKLRDAVIYSEVMTPKFRSKE